MATDLPIIIIGSGFSGIAMGVLLRKAGIETFTILEKADDLGGTWRDNTYPGAACDIPSHLYSFSFEPKPDWSHSFSGHHEIKSYLSECVDKYDLRRHIRFGRKVVRATFRAGAWSVETANGELFEGRALVLGNGALHLPSYPDIPGFDDFAGKMFHSSRWDHSYDLKGKKVAVIGTGASAIQFVPEIAEQPDQLSIFQRTPPWIVPKSDRPMRAREKGLFRKLPILHKLYRTWLYWTHELRAIGFVVNPRLMRFAERLARGYIEASIADPELRRKVTPDYTMGCKRILLSNDYYQALQRPNVDVVTDPIERITANAVHTRSGAVHEVDAIICGTGYSVAEYLAPIEIIGPDGNNLNAVMQSNGQSYYGITVRGFPNLFLMMGPNTGLGHNSMVFMIEAQARYALQGIQALQQRPGVSLEVRQDVQTAFHAQLQDKLKTTVWNTGCSSWYLKGNQNISIWPGFTFQYWLQTRRLNLADYELVANARVGDLPIDRAHSAGAGLGSRRTQRQSRSEPNRMSSRIE